MKSIEEPLSLDQIREKRTAIIKSVKDNATASASNKDDHNEHLIGKIPRDVLESVYQELDVNLSTTYFRLRYSKPWSYLFGLDCIVDVHITFPDQDRVKSLIYEEIRAEQQLQFSKFKFERSYSNVSSLYTDYHNYKIALIPLGFTVTVDTSRKVVMIGLTV